LLKDLFEGGGRDEKTISASFDSLPIPISSSGKEEKIGFLGPTSLSKAWTWGEFILWDVKESRVVKS
jgi:hypothetical protein